MKSERPNTMTKLSPEPDHWDEPDDNDPHTRSMVLCPTEGLQGPNDRSLETQNYNYRLYVQALCFVYILFELMCHSLGTRILMTNMFLTVGRTHSTMGKYEEAINFFQIAAIICTEDCGTDNSRLVQCLGLVGDASFYLSRFDASIQWCTEALKISQRPRSASVYIVETLARSYTGKGMYKKAIRIYEEVLDIKRARFPAEHLEIADTIHNMGITLQGMGKVVRAIDSFGKALHIYEKQPPSRDMAIRIANATKNLACVYSHGGQHAKAVFLFEYALQVEKKAGRNDIGVVNTLTNLGVSYAQLGLGAAAISNYNQALHLVHEQYQSDCRIEIGDLFYNVAIAEAPKHNRAARKYLRRCIFIFTTCLGAKHQKSLRAKAYMKILIHERKRMLHQKNHRSRKAPRCFMQHRPTGFERSYSGSSL